MQEQALPSPTSLVARSPLRDLCFPALGCRRALPFAGRIGCCWFVSNTYGMFSLVRAARRPSGTIFQILLGGGALELPRPHLRGYVQVLSSAVQTGIGSFYMRGREGPSGWSRAGRCYWIFPFRAPGPRTLSCLSAPSSPNARLTSVW